MRQILCVVHQTTSNPGRVGRTLKAFGYQLDRRVPSSGDPLPQTLDPYEGVIVFGGPMSANDGDRLDYIRTELAWLDRVVVPADKPFFGICLGAQLLAKVLGAQVTPHPDGTREIGYREIIPTLAGRDALGQLKHVYHWHAEGFEIPAGGVKLASGELFPNQAFRWGDRFYGVQFHPEMTREMVEYWMEAAAEQIQLPEAQPRAEQLQGYDRHSSESQQWLEHFLPRWLHGGDRQLSQAS